MPSCYLLAVAGGSSVDQHSNNVTLFSLVEQIGVPPGAPPPPGGVILLELHAYFALDPAEQGQSFELRFAMVAASGLETYSEVSTHRVITPRYRTRSVGLPFPPVMGAYELRVDVRSVGSASWQRASTAWPVVIGEYTPEPRVTH
ncbi:MAG: hypothetical protein OZ921_18705 [Sorangiineae bacterium]|nr:hypothetical protein [Polyangiaceae bacterium]MEB2324553.1 hypothetical protein [Sorangiineae bacterium]